MTCNFTVTVFLSINWSLWRGVTFHTKDEPWTLSLSQSTVNTRKQDRRGENNEEERNQGGGKEGVKSREANNERRLMRKGTGWQHREAEVI